MESKRVEVEGHEWWRDIRFEFLGRGVTRIHWAGTGYADVAAVFSSGYQGWFVEVQQTNVRNPELLAKMVEQFKVAEGLQ